MRCPDPRGAPEQGYEVSARSQDSKAGRNHRAACGATGALRERAEQVATCSQCVTVRAAGEVEAVGARTVEVDEAAENLLVQAVAPARGPAAAAARQCHDRKRAAPGATRAIADPRRATPGLGCSPPGGPEGRRHDPQPTQPRGGESRRVRRTDAIDRRGLPARPQRRPPARAPWSWRSAAGCSSSARSLPIFWKN